MKTIPERVRASWLATATGLLLFASTSPLAGEIHFRHLTVDDGLSQSHVETIVQDRDGYVWLGTASGLNRFDGYDVRIYRHDPDDSSSLSHDGVYALHTDEQDTVWIGTGEGLNRFVPETDSFVRWTSDRSDPGTLLPGGVNAIASDRSGTLWVGTEGLNQLDPRTGTVVRYPIGQAPGRRVQAIHEDSRGGLWIGVGSYEPPASPGDGLYRFDRASGTFVRYRLVPPEAEPASPGGPAVTSIAEDVHGRLWVGTWGHGLFWLDEEQVSFTRFSETNSGNDDFVRKVLPDGTGAVWVITSRTEMWFTASGRTDLLKLDPAIGIVQQFTSPDAAHAQTDVILDRAGTLWFGTSGSGAFFGDTVAGHLDHYGHEPNNPNSLASSFVRAVFVDDDGTVWVGSPKGLDRIDRAINEVHHYAHDSADPSSLGADRVHSIRRDRAGALWVGTAGGGLSRLRFDGSGFDHFRHDRDNPASISSDLVTVILESRDGALWIGTGNEGLNRFDSRQSGFDRYLQDAEDAWNSIVTLFEDSRGTLWIGTRLGLARLDPGQSSVVRYGPDVAGPEALIGLQINSILEIPEQAGLLWLGTGGSGLVRFDPTTNIAEVIDGDGYGLPDNSVNGVLADDSGRLWISTQRGFARFDPAAREFRQYGLDRGLQSIEFNRGAYHRGPGGELFFGGVDGLNSFFPEAMIDNTIAPQVALTRVQAIDRSSANGESEGRTVLRHGALLEAATFSPSQRDVSFEFTALHYTNPALNRYAYRLDGFDTSWRDAGFQRTVSFTNLDYGSYTFHVKAANAHGVWSTGETSFSFSIKRPFWRQWWFYLLSGLIALGMVWGGYGWKLLQHRRQREAMERAIAERTEQLRTALATVEAQTERLRELDEAKSRFVANISHELRTPLTLIAGPLEDIRDGALGPVSNEALQELDVAVRNGRRLQRLVDQLLSVSKLEAGELRLRVQEGDLVDFLRGLALAFSPLAERRQIEFRTAFPDVPVMLWFDGHKLEEVFTNLLSNSFKFTPEGGTVLLRVREHPTDGTIDVEVRDSGPGIPAKHLPHVFERFYRVEEAGFVARPGTGIGLSLAMELVELHGGYVLAESEVGFGSSFTVRLKKGHAHFDETQIDRSAPFADGPGTAVVSAIDDLAEPIRPDIADEREADDLATVLVVDDNRDIRRLLRRHFIEDYRVLEAENGAEGLARARESMPDVIVSDVLMPEMDGEAMCRAIKADPDLEFIPVVLLTARAETSDKVGGLEGGADDYVTKPFDARELRARVANLIKLRHRLKSRIEEHRNVVAFRPAPTGLPPADAHFLGRVREVVEARLSAEDFGVEELAAELRMSRVHLYRRLREIGGPSPAELLMERRLERAAELLAQGAGTVSEVAYGVGFKSLSHFTRRFRKKYDESPSGYRSRHTHTGA